MRHIIGLICLAAFFALLITGCSKAPGSVIEDFYNAKTWDERKAFILDANGLKEKDVYDEATNYIIEDIVLLKNVDETSLVYKVVFKSEGDKKRIKRFLITKVGEDEKIDFKTTIGRIWGHIKSEFMSDNLLNAGSETWTPQSGITP